MLQSIKFLRKKSRGEVDGDTKPTPLAPVILGLVPRIFWQQGTNLVNKLALLNKCLLREDSWDKPKNDWCRGRGVSAYSQSGRSMIEMLGVLAIIAVLSVGGIAGYSKAMEKFKVNKLVEECTNLMFGLMQHIDYFTPLHTEGEYQERYYLAETIQGLNLVPVGWRKHGSGQCFIDSSGNMIYTYVRGNMITFDLQLGAIDGSGSYNIIQSFSNKLCFELFNNMLQPLHGSLFVAGIWKNKSAGVTYYGDKYCGAENKCLRAATLSDMHNLCNSCTIKKENCIVVWELDNT